jgi:magnesium transporter
MGAMDGSTERYVDSSVWKLIRKRVPWLIILLLAGTITTNVLNWFEPITLAATFLIWFVPVITQTGGNSGTQSSTLMIRGLATGEVHFRDIGRVLAKELAVGILMGLILGLVILGRGIFLPPGIELLPAIAVGASLVFVVVFSSLIGAFAPLLIHRRGADPTVMAGPLMATIIDVAGLTIYFQIARLILGL